MESLSQMCVLFVFLEIEGCFFILNTTWESIAVVINKNISHIFIQSCRYSSVQKGHLLDTKFSLEQNHEHLRVNVNVKPDIHGYVLLFYLLY